MINVYKKFNASLQIQSITTLAYLKKIHRLMTSPYKKTSQTFRYNLITLGFA